MLRDRASFLGLGSGVASTGATVAAGGPGLQSRVDELEAEVTRLRAQLSRAKGVNDAMWGAVAKTITGVEAELSHEVTSQEEVNRGRKKGRV
jgi:pre-rRNA-processing protein IPI3